MQINKIKNVMLQLQVNFKATTCKIRKEANMAKSSRKKTKVTWQRIASLVLAFIYVQYSKKLIFFTQQEKKFQH
jgi:hypothetical protein